MKTFEELEQEKQFEFEKKYEQAKKKGESEWRLFQRRMFFNMFKEKRKLEHERLLKWQ